MPKTFIDRLCVAAFLLGGCVLLFLSGALVMEYRLPPSALVKEAADSAAIWLEQWARLQDDAPSSVKIRRLPEVKTVWDKERAYKGYTLVILRYSDVVSMIDMDGKEVHRWNIPFAKITASTRKNAPAGVGITANKAVVFPNGDLLFVLAGEGDTPYGYGMAKLDKDSNILWTYNEHAHNDIYIDKENGSIYTLTHDFIKDPVPGAEDLHYPMLAHYVVRLSPEGKELEKLSLLEAFLDTPYELALYRVKRGKRAWDTFHANSIMKLEPSLAAKFPMFASGQLLVSIRNLNTLAVIDPKTRKVVWAYNGLLKHQHSASFLANGHILAFDNLGHSTAKRWENSRILEIDPAMMQVAWSYGDGKKEAFRSRIYGRAQRLPNGNTLITHSLGACLMEVDTEKKTVWSYRSCERYGREDSYVIMSATRYAPEEVLFLPQ